MSTQESYLRSFVIGSSFPAFALFFYGVTQIKEKTFGCESYTLLTPVYFGVMNMLALYLGRLFGLSLWQRLLLISQISALIVITRISMTRPYTFKTPARWCLQYLLVYLAHVFTFMVPIYFLEYFLEKNTSKRAS